MTQFFHPFSFFNKAEDLFMEKNKTFYLIRLKYMLTNASRNFNAKITI